MSDPNSLSEPSPNKLTFTEPRWQLFYALQRGVKGANLMLPFSPIDHRFSPFFLHTTNEPDVYVFIEKPTDVDELGIIYEARTEENGFTLAVKAGIRDEDWDSGIVDKEASEAHMGFQDDLGLSVPNEDELQRFSMLVEAFASELLNQ